jgi:hypothetical protein
MVVKWVIIYLRAETSNWRGEVIFQNGGAFIEISKKTVNCGRCNKSLLYSLDGNLLRIRDKWNRCVKITDHFYIVIM